MDYLIILLMPIAFPFMLLFYLAIFRLIGVGLEKLFPIKEIPPYCDIDPLCHSGFVWVNSKNGIGKINGVKITIR